MTIDFMAKIIAFDCYLTKLRLLHVLKTRAVTAKLMSPEKRGVESHRTAELGSRCSNRCKQKVHRASGNFQNCPIYCRAALSLLDVSSPPADAWLHAKLVKTL